MTLVSYLCHHSVELMFTFFCLLSRCGLVALAMADSVLNNGVTIEKVTEASKRKGFSKQGEMFSCKFFYYVNSTYQ